MAVLYWANRFAPLVPSASSDVPGIWRMPVGGGEETRITEAGGENLFCRRAPRSLVLRCGSDEPFRYVEVLRRGYRQHKNVPRVARGDQEIDTASPALSVSPDGRWISYTQIDQLGSNLLVLDGIRSYWFGYGNIHVGR